MERGQQPRLQDRQRRVRQPRRQGHQGQQQEQQEGVARQRRGGGQPRLDAESKRLRKEQRALEQQQGARRCCNCPTEGPLTGGGGPRWFRHPVTQQSFCGTCHAYAYNHNGRMRPTRLMMLK